MRAAGIALALALLPTAVHAQQTSLPPRQEATVLARVVAYDEALDARAGDSVTIGVLYSASNSTSSIEGNAIFGGFKELENRKLRGLPFRVARVLWSDADTLRRTLEQQGIDALYVSSGLENDIGAITKVTRERDVLTLTGSKDYIAAGVSVCATSINGKPQLLLNQKASSAEGAKFGTEFLQLTTLVE